MATSTVAASTVAAITDPPPPPPPTSDALGLELYSPIPKSPVQRGLNTSNRKCMLPFIEPPPSGGSVSLMRSEAQPTSTTNDFLPSDLLLALKRQDNVNLRSTPRNRSAKWSSPSSTPRQLGGGLQGIRPPAPMWSYSSRRERLKHLTDAPPCICGAGRDISFLYDSPPKERDGISKKFVPSDTIIPEEYHIVKHPGVLGLEFHDENYSTLSEKHDYHMTVFPSTKPSGRHEAVALLHTFDSMLQRAGIPTEIKDSDLKGPTEMHNLLDLVQKEQTIYNVVFHELIRQVSVHCVERGELLADLRRRYANLLDRIPRQVKSLHDEVLAQRMLDRKLTGELNKFRGKIASLTEELSAVKEHDLHVTEQSRHSEETLTTALATSQKSAEILNEYHELYELQRRRLEDVVAQLTSDQELWQQASYDLSMRVAEEYDVQTLQRLQLNERSWSKLAGHFTIMLSSRDSQQLSEIQENILQWKDKLKEFLTKLDKMEASMKERLLKVRDGFVKWIEVHNKTINDDGSVSVPSQKYLGHLWAEMKIWQGILNKEAENFAGDNLINNQESVRALSELVEKWTSIALVIFGRHKQERGGAAPDNTDAIDERPSIVGVKEEGEGHEGEGEEDDGETRMAQQFGSMVQLKRAIEAKLAMYECRSAGENGIATGFVHLSTPLEAWDTKLSIIMTSTEKKLFLPASDWIKFGKLLEDWKERIEEIISWIGTVPDPPSVAVEVEGSEETVETEGSEEEEEEEGKEEGESEMGEEGEREEREEKKVRKLEEREKRKARKREERERKKKKKKKDKRKETVSESEVNVSEMSVEELCSEVERWSSGLSYAVDNQDNKRSEQVSRLHSDLIKWIVKLLLSITATDETGPGGSGDEAEEERRLMKHIQNTANLKTDYTVLAQALMDFTTRLNRSCMELVRETVEERTKHGHPNPEEEKLDLQRMEEEAQELTTLAETLVKKVRSGYRASRRSTLLKNLKEAPVPVTDGVGEVTSEVVIKVEDTSQPPAPAEGGGAGEGAEISATQEEAVDLDATAELESRRAPTASPDEMHVMGHDKNIHQKLIKKVIEETEALPIASSSDLGLATEEAVPNGRGTSPDNSEKLIILLDKARESLKEEQTLKKELEEKFQVTEKELSESKSKIAELEEELKSAKAASLHHHKSHSKGSKSGSSRKSVVSRGSSRK